ncbi:MAG: hypothetical protein ABI076_11380 [Acidobacteriaceae bacterium]
MRIASERDVACWLHGFDRATRRGCGLQIGFEDQAGHHAIAAATWASRSTVEKKHFLKAILDRIIIHPKCVEILLRIPQLMLQLAGNISANSESEIHATAHLPQITPIKCSFRHVSQGNAIRLIVGNSQLTTEASRLAILKAIARARLWYQQLVEGVTPASLTWLESPWITPTLIEAKYFSFVKEISGFPGARWACQLAGTMTVNAPVGSVYRFCACSNGAALQKQQSPAKDRIDAKRRVQLRRRRESRR